MPDGNFKIEKGVPVPPVSKYPFADMAVGDSFVAPVYSKHPKTPKASLAASYWKKSHPGWDYTCRREGDHFRLWRTA